jgi:hypothetical protein
VRHTSLTAYNDVNSGHRNAERLEELARLEDLGDTEVWKDQPLISLLNEYVPPNFGPRLEFSGDEKQAPLALTLAPDDTHVAPTPQATPQAVDVHARIP